MAKKKRIWRYTEARKKNMEKAIRKHQVLVRLGKKAYARGER